MKVKEKVYEILKDLSCMEAVNDNDSLLEDLPLDSLAMVTLLVELEDALSVPLDESDMNPFDLITVGDVVRLAEKYGGDQNMRLWNFIQTRMAGHPTQTVCENDYEISFSMLVRQTEQFAASLSGLRCVAILCDSALTAAKALLACFAAEVTAVPLSKRYGELHCNKILAKISPDAMITDENGMLTVKKLPDPEYVEPEIHPALIMCTSGTTGDPKGAMLSEENILTNVSDIADYFDMIEDDTILIARPLYHCAVLTGEFLTALIKGTRIRFYSEAFNPPMMPELICKYGITVFCGTPTLLCLMSRFVRKEAELPLKHIAVSGECMSRDAGLRIAETFPQAKIYHVYGLTEACPRVSYLSPELFRHYPDRVGIPLKSVEVKVVKKNGTLAETDEKGVLYIRGGNVMIGYYSNPDKTSEVLKNGWLYTGDIASVNSAGLLKIHGRNDNLIIRAGMNIYPQEIEGTLKADKRVREVLAYGYTTPTGTQIGLKIAGDFTTVSEIKRLCAELLPSYQIPMKI